MIDVKLFQTLNKLRGERWHQGDLSNWTLLEWAGAMCGEAGEAANYAKKIRRIDLKLPNKEKGLDVAATAALKAKMAKELADTIIYSLLCFSALDMDAEEYLRMVFNDKSIEYGFPERV